MKYRLERGRKFRYANGLGILELDRKKNRTFAARKSMVQTITGYLFIHAIVQRAAQQSKSGIIRVVLTSKERRVIIFLKGKQP
jgi:hypothetical protein